MTAAPATAIPTQFPIGALSLPQGTMSFLRTHGLLHYVLQSYEGHVLKESIGYESLSELFQGIQQDLPEFDGLLDQALQQEQNSHRKPGSSLANEIARSFQRISDAFQAYQMAPTDPATRDEFLKAMERHLPVFIHLMSSESE